VRGRLFAQLDDHHHGADRLAVWLPAAVGVREMLIGSDPTRFFVPPYVGPRGWVGVRIDRRPDWRVVATLVRDAWAQMAPAGLSRGGPDTSGSRGSARGRRGRRAPPARSP
jgi:hypothetical protein